MRPTHILLLLLLLLALLALLALLLLLLLLALLLALLLLLSAEAPPPDAVPGAVRRFLAAGAGCFGLPAAEEAPSCFASRAERRTAGIDSGASDPQARTLDRINSFPSERCISCLAEHDRIRGARPAADGELGLTWWCGRGAQRALRVLGWPRREVTGCVGSAGR